MVNMDEIDPAAKEQIHQARVLFARRAIDKLDLLRSLPALAGQFSLLDLSFELGVTEPVLEALLLEATEVEPVSEGFSGGNPYEIAQRYAIGQLTREEVVDELSRWPYEPDEWEGWEGYTPGTWSRYVSPARHAELIDGGVYTEVMTRLKENAETDTTADHP